MPNITLPDGTVREYPEPVTVMEVAESIGAGLARATLAGKVDGRLVDASQRIDDDAELSIVTERDPEGIEILRHSCAHLLAMAVKQLFPAAQVTIGPVIEDGFYYDFAFERPFTPEDLEQIEARMVELAKKDFPVSRSILSREEAIRLFEGMDEAYKVRIIRDIPGEEDLSFYRQGDFIDLCRGPHIPSTGRLKAFRLTKVAGAYWRGDSKNEMLQRIYGTCWPDKKQLKAYLHRLEEAEKRDHRKLGKRLDLFHFQEEAPGMVFWHDHGWTIYRTIEDYIRRRLREHEYVEVRTPQVVDRSLWEKSGHWDKFGDAMFCTSSESHDYAVKPMNCPCHVQIYNQGLKSYRDLPIRMAEFGSCHRNEPSGTLHGLLRVRGFTQDDAHIFCAQEQIQDEVSHFIDLLFSVYRDFGFDDVIVKFSTRPDERVGSDAVWDRAEEALEQSLKLKELEYDVQPGEGAFYGPKIEFSLRDCIGRVWQLGTIQLDFSMPDRLGAQFVDESGERQTPVMLHRAILGSMERFIGILIEQFAGELPLWLAPVQAVVLNITDHQAEYARKIKETLLNNGFRVQSDLRNEKIGFKIREHTLLKVPYQLVIGDREMDSGTVAVRLRGGKDLGGMPVEELMERMRKEVAQLGRAEVEN